MPALTNCRPAETDYVFDVKQGGYYGHPNPVRCEWVLNGGNPTAGTDPFQVAAYPVGHQPDRNFDLAGMYDAGLHASANGAIEYRGRPSAARWTGKLLVVRYSAGQDIETFDVAANGTLIEPTTGITGFTGFSQPLDITEDTGHRQPVRHRAGRQPHHPAPTPARRVADPPDQGVTTHFGATTRHWVQNACAASGVAKPSCSSTQKPAPWSASTSEVRLSTRRTGMPGVGQAGARGLRGRAAAVGAAVREDIDQGVRAGDRRRRGAGPGGRRRWRTSRRLPGNGSRTPERATAAVAPRASTIAAVPATQFATRGLRLPEPVALISGGRSGSWASPRRPRRSTAWAYP